MGTPSFRRLPRRRSVKEIDAARARWELRFYCWRSFLVLGVLTAQAVEAVLALVEGRPPHLMLPWHRP